VANLVVNFQSIPLTITNPEAAVGGDNPESLERAKTLAGESPEEAARRTSAARKTALLNEAGKLVLHSVMGGKLPLARINDETVTVGDTVAEYFTVAEIEGRNVTITADGEAFTLSMQAGNVPPAGNSPAPKRRP
jgi:hypothetical protein